MSDEETAQTRKNQRRGFTRFIVPHKSFSWLMQGIWLMSLATGILIGGIAWILHYHFFDAVGIFTLGVHPGVVERYMRFTILNAMIVALASATYITLIAAFVFHRLSGPIYRIERHMEGVIAGDVTTECSLRARDQLRDFCATYNRLLHGFDVIEPKPLPEADLRESSRVSLRTQKGG